MEQLEVTQKEQKIICNLLVKKEQDVPTCINKNIPCL